MILLSCVKIGVTGGGMTDEEGVLRRSGLDEVPACRRKSSPESTARVSNDTGQRVQTVRREDGCHAIWGHALCSSLDASHTGCLSSEAYWPIKGERRGQSVEERVQFILH